MQKQVIEMIQDKQWEDIAMSKLQFISPNQYYWQWLTIANTHNNSKQNDFFYFFFWRVSLYTPSMLLNIFAIVETMKNNDRKIAYQRQPAFERK